MNEKQQLIVECDGLWSQLIKQKFKGKCFFCDNGYGLNLGGPGTDAHHWAFGRGDFRFRWDLHNGVWCHRKCHQLAHDHMEQTKTFIIYKACRALEWYNSYVYEAPRPWTKNDILDVRDQLIQKLGAK